MTITFYVSAPDEITFLAPLGTKRHNLSGLSILVMEDNIINQKILTKILGDSHALVNCAIDGSKLILPTHSSLKKFVDKSVKMNPFLTFPISSLFLLDTTIVPE